MGGGIGMVVEYLGDSISKKLLSKFPHYNINIDFDHSQSSIWSPLVHPYLPPLSFHSHHYQDDDDDESKRNKKIFKSPAGNNTSVQNLNTRFRNLMKQSSNKTMMKQKQKQKQKKKKNISARLFNFSPVPLAAMAAASTPTPKKRWNKILKVASKGFKKTSKKKDRGAQITLLSNCLVNAMV